MNREEIERKILLAESGELPEDEAKELEAVLEADEQARTFRADTRRMVRDTRRYLKADGPREQVMIRIRKEAATAVAPKPLLIFRHPAASALACAAALLIVVSSWLALRTPAPVLSPVDQVQTLVVMVTEEEELVEPVETQSREGEMKELARQLLRMQGLHVEEESTDLEEAFWALPPTALQGRSTPASQAT